MDSFSTLTTFKVGGAVQRVVRARSADALVYTITEISAHNDPYIIVGGGSNILADDADYEGTVVIPSFTRVTFDNDTIEAEAGALWDRVVEESVAHGLWGIENLSGIPGTVGGAVVANIGAYGAALSQVLVSVDVYDSVEAMRRTLDPAMCGLGYRASIFKQHPERYAILAATLRLSRTPHPNLSYRDLATSFPTGAADLSTIREAILAIRARKFPPLSHYGTAGSFFLNPIATARAATTLQRQYPEMPLYELPEGGVKVPLAWILDHVVHAKGMREGHAFVWDAQPLVIATEAGATARDVRTLAGKIARAVKEKTAIDIIPEVRVLEK